MSTNSPLRPWHIVSVVGGIVGLFVTVASGWVALDRKSSVNEAKVLALELRFDRVESRTDDKLAALKAELDRLNEITAKIWDHLRDQ